MLTILDSNRIDEIGPFTHEKTVILKDKRGWLRYIAGVCVSIFKECISRLNRAGNPFKGMPFPYLTENGDYAVDNQPWLTQPSSRLIVLIHGLNSSPLCWTKYIQELSKSDSTTSLFTPYVYKKGYCRLKEAARPIFHVVQRYTLKYPDNPIILVGHSNGARIAQYIEKKLDAHPIRFVSIAGPHLGSKLINWIDFLGISRWIGLSEGLVEELKYEDQWVKQQLSKWQKKSAEKTGNGISRHFFASADDLRIFPYNTSFPTLPHSTYTLIGRESHVTIIDAVCDKVLEQISEYRHTGI